MILIAGGCLISFKIGFSMCARAKSTIKSHKWTLSCTMCFLDTCTHSYGPKMQRFPPWGSMLSVTVGFGLVKTQLWRVAFGLLRLTGHVRLTLQKPCNWLTGVADKRATPAFTSAGHMSTWTTCYWSVSMLHVLAVSIHPPIHPFTRACIHSFISPTARGEWGGDKVRTGLNLSGTCAVKSAVSCRRSRPYECWYRRELAL